MVSPQMPRRPTAATPLSHPNAAGSQGSRGIRGLACLSLLLGLVAPTSCIVSEPAEYGVAKQTPPFLDAKNAAPSVLHTHKLSLGDTLLVNVPFRSEDAGEELRALLWLDKGVIGKKTLLNFREIPPGKLEDDKRSIDIPGDIQVAGCHSMSLVVTHRSNLDNNEPVDDDDTAILTWWLNVADEGQTLLGDCPALGGGT